MSRSAQESRKVLVVGTFRSGTNAMKACLERYFHTEVTFNEWFWKHGSPPTGIQCQVPTNVPIVIMSKSPSAFVQSLYPFWIHRRPNLDAGRTISEFIRKELLVYDNSGGNHGRPKYWFRSPVDYWNHYYYSWLGWEEVRLRGLFVRYKDVARSTETEVSKVAAKIGLSRRVGGPIMLPQERVGPHVPTTREGERFRLTEDDLDWIRQNASSRVALSLGYKLDDL